MPRLRIVDRWRQSGVDYLNREVVVGRFAGKISPEVMGHEIAHYSLGHEVERNPILEFQQELKAWDYALEKAPGGEWDRLLVKTALEGYVDEIYYVRGEE